MPPSRASSRARRAGSSISNMTVATSSRPLRDQRVVGGELVVDLRVAALLDVQHLLHLLPHRVEILEIEGRERADLDPPALLDLGNLGAPLLDATLAYSSSGRISARVSRRLVDC